MNDVNVNNSCKPKIGVFYVCWDNPSFRYLAECISIVKNTPIFVILGDIFEKQHNFKHYEEYDK